jgi:hypothetical protein
MEWLLRRFLFRHPLIRLARGGLDRARNIARRLNNEWRINLVLHTAQLTEVWLQRPAGLDWAVSHHTHACGPTNAAPIWLTQVKPRKTVFVGNPMNRPMKTT